MGQIPAFVDALKRTLKMRGVTYRDVAKALSISEASVKRLFAERSFSLERLERVLELAQTSLVELVQQMDAERRTLDELAEEQERELVSDPGLLLVTFLIVNGWQYDAILRDYQFSAAQLIRHLARLDRIKLIELLPNNRVQLRVSPRFGWRKNGPIQRFFVEHLQQDFFNSRFAGEDETFRFLTAMLTPASRGVLQKRMDDLAREFNELNEVDKHLPIERRWLCSMAVALRPWRPLVFEEFVRKS